ncbi:MAG TPA: hypothetical protein VKA06_09545 [Spirochaetia bacterium]|nr:hypothetical protein [Spirochaetia bacterium]
MIVLGTIGIRYFETGTLVLLLVATILVFLRRRPAGLVWFSALAVGTMAAHLFIEEGRWQLIPAYLLLFVLAFWLARPAGQPYRSARPYRAPGLIVRVVVALLALPALLLPFMAPLFVLPLPEGPHPVGSANVLVHDESPRSHTVWYPAAADRAARSGAGAAAGAATLAPFWSSDDLAAHRLPGLPWLLSTHLTLVPTPAGYRAPILESELPLLLLLPAEGSLPGDYVRLALEAASAGWLVVKMPGEPGTERVLATIAALADPDTDAALSGRVDPDRLAVLLTGTAPEPALGVPVIRVGTSSLFEAGLPSSSFEVLFPDAEIPASAFTTRALMVHPARLLVGSSDIAPGRIDSVLRHLLRTVLADGSPDAPVFSGTQPSQAELLSGASDATIRALPGGR